MKSESYHDIVKVVIENTPHRQSQGVYVRKLCFIDEGGHVYELTLFGPNTKGLVTQRVPHEDYLAVVNSETVDIKRGARK